MKKASIEKTKNGFIVENLDTGERECFLRVNDAINYIVRPMMQLDEYGKGVEVRDNGKKYETELTVNFWSYKEIKEPEPVQQTEPVTDAEPNGADSFL